MKKQAYSFNSQATSRLILNIVFPSSTAFSIRFSSFEVLSSEIMENSNLLVMNEAKHKSLIGECLVNYLSPAAYYLSLTNEFQALVALSQK